MPYLTLTENLKLQLRPGLVASYDIQPRNGVGLFWDKHSHVYLLTYLPRTHTMTMMMMMIITITVLTGSLPSIASNHSLRSSSESA